MDSKTLCDEPRQTLNTDVGVSLKVVVRCFPGVAVVAQQSDRRPNSGRDTPNSLFICSETDTLNFATMSCTETEFLKVNTNHYTTCDKSKLQLQSHNCCHQSNCRIYSSPEQLTNCQDDSDLYH